MAYNEELDLIQNVKQLSEEVSNAIELVAGAKDSVEEIKELNTKFNELKETTLDIINQYGEELNTKSTELSELLINARSQFKQVTDDVEALVNLEVDFTSIREKIEQCLVINERLVNLISESTILMSTENYVEVEDRKPYKRYLKVLSTVNA